MKTKSFKWSIGHERRSRDIKLIINGFDRFIVAIICKLYLLNIKLKKKYSNNLANQNFAINYYFCYIFRLK